METSNQHRWVEPLLTSAVVAAAFTFATAALKVVTKFLPRYFAMKESVDFVATINDQSPAYREMELAVSEDGAQSVVMLALHNGGAMPHMTSPIYVSAVHVAADSIRNKHSAAKYQNVEIDSHYLDMCISMHAKGSHRFDMVEEEKKNSLFWQFHHSDGVTDSFLCYLGVWKKKFVFVSFRSYGGRFMDEQLVRFRLRANVIRNLAQG